MAFGYLYLGAFRLVRKVNMVSSFAIQLYEASKLSTSLTTGSVLDPAGAKKWVSLHSRHRTIMICEQIPWGE